MTRRIVPLLLAAAFLAAPAAGRQAPAAPDAAPAPRAAPDSAPNDGRQVFVVTDKDRDGAAPRARIYTLRTDGGNAVVLRAKDGQTYRIDRDHGVFVVNAGDGASYRVEPDHGGVIVIRAEDGRVYRVKSGPDRAANEGEASRVIRFRTMDGAAGGIADTRHVLVLDGGHGLRQLALEDCGGAAPLVDRSDGEGSDRTRIILCGNQARGPADRSVELEHMLERLQDMDGVSDSVKLRVSAALRDAIEQLRRER
ncbi:MAG TPA: hypothetical protein VFW19_09570 [Allosphingosinicella sp.]|nr:hypothetical protein [Allosphingosinicella sp.]